MMKVHWELWPHQACWPDRACWSDGVSMLLHDPVKLTMLHVGIVDTEDYDRHVKVHQVTN